VQARRIGNITLLFTWYSSGASRTPPVSPAPLGALPQPHQRASGWPALDAADSRPAPQGTDRPGAGEPARLQGETAANGCRKAERRQGGRRGLRPRRDWCRRVRGQAAAKARAAAPEQQRDTLGVRCRRTVMPPHPLAGRGSSAGAGPAKGGVVPTSQQSGRGLQETPDDKAQTHYTDPALQSMRTTNTGWE
jgi:hypothetical protein